MNYTAIRGGISLTKTEELKELQIKVLPMGILGGNIMSNIINTRKNIEGYDKYIIREAGSWVVVDNSTGDAWTEAFKYFQAAIKFLTEEGSTVEELQKDSDDGYFWFTREDIRAIVQGLSKCQGSYTRMNAAIEALEEEIEENYEALMDELEKQQFKDAVDFVLYVEG